MTTRRAIAVKAAQAPAAKPVLCVSPAAEALHKSMKAFGKNVAKDPEAARAFLQRAGIVTRNGKLAKAYGG